MLDLHHMLIEIHLNIPCVKVELNMFTYVQSILILLLKYVSSVIHLSSLCP